MKPSKLNFFGVSRYWWVVLVIGILMILGGFAYWFWPAVGYAVASQIFGWLLVLFGVVQLCVSAGPDRPRGWGWWLACGIINMFVGFMLVRSVILSELVFPYFIALVFAMFGVAAIFAAFGSSGRKNWWLYLINGILMLIIAYFFAEAGYVKDMLMTSLLTAIGFIYWGFSIAMISYDMRPTAK